MQLVVSDFFELLFDNYALYKVNFRIAFWKQFWNSQFDPSSDHWEQ